MTGDHSFSEHYHLRIIRRTRTRFWEVHTAIVTQQLFDPTGVLNTGVYMSCRRAGKVLGVMGPYPLQRFAGGAEQGSGDERAA